MILISIYGFSIRARNIVRRDICRPVKKYVSIPDKINEVDDAILRHENNEVFQDFRCSTHTIRTAF